MVDIELELPARSSEGMGALDVFYLDFNEINFYVEDADQENLYEEILKKWFPEVKFSRIFPLGGKPAVLKHAEDPSNRGLKTKCVYIVDKDFDDLLNRMNPDQRIFYLEGFCIENHILDALAVARVVVETHPKQKIPVVLEELKIDDFSRTTLFSLAPLFQLFYCVQALGLDLKNCKCKAEEYCVANKPWLIDTERIRQYLAAAKSTASSQGLLDEFDRLLRATTDLFLDEKNHHRLISGKLTLALIFHFLKTKYKLGSISFESFVFRLAKNSNMLTLESTMKKIRNHLEAIV